MRRFIAEARAASALNHPNILTVFDADVGGAIPYIVSELIDGTSLREEIRRGPVPLKRLLDLATQIADGLAEAHAAGIVHRDLKPENIMITRGGRAKILDFGLARPNGLRSSAPVSAGAGVETLTETGLLAGTVPYMSPEQPRGLVTDSRSDQFAVGLILYEMVTGHPPFSRDTPAATLDAIVNDEPPPWSGDSPQPPVMLRWIIERCLAKNPAERYGVTADLFRDLRTLRDRLPEAVAPSPRTAETTTTRRSTGFWIAQAALLAALAGAGAIAWRLATERPAFDLTDLHFRALATDAAYQGLPACCGSRSRMGADANREFLGQHTVGDLEQRRPRSHHGARAGSVEHRQDVRADVSGGGGRQHRVLRREVHLQLLASNHGDPPG